MLFLAIRTLRRRLAAPNDSLLDTIDSLMDLVSSGAEKKKVHMIQINKLEDFQIESALKRASKECQSYQIVRKAKI